MVANGWGFSGTSLVPKIFPRVIEFVLLVDLVQIDG